MFYVILWVEENCRAMSLLLLPFFKACFCCTLRRYLSRAVTKSFKDLTLTLLIVLGLESRLLLLFNVTVPFALL